jgi:hypothetical protein
MKNFYINVKNIKINSFIVANCKLKNVDKKGGGGGRSGVWNEPGLDLIVNICVI